MTAKKQIVLEVVESVSDKPKSPPKPPVFKTSPKIPLKPPAKVVGHKSPVPPKFNPPKPKKPSVKPPPPPPNVKASAARAGKPPLKDRIKDLKR